MAVLTLPPAASSTARGLVPVEPGGLHHDALAPVDQLVVPGAQVHHQVAVDLASRIIAPVVRVLSTSLVAVPAFMRVEPVTTSGPTSTVMHTSQVSRSRRGRLRAGDQTPCGRRASAPGTSAART